MTEPRTHRVKSWPYLFEATVSGAKRHEMRRDDRGYAVGDRLLLLEFIPETQVYTGREALYEILYVTSAGNPCALSDAGLHEGFCVLSVAPVRS